MTQLLRSPVPPVFFHVHIPKCGGSSLNVLLERWFNGRFAYCYSSHADHILSIREMTEFVDQNPSVNCVASHAIRAFPRMVSDRPAYYITFLRDPVDRLISCAKHLLREFDMLGEGHDKYLLNDAKSVPDLLSVWIHYASQKLPRDPVGASSLARYFLPRERINFTREASGSFDSEVGIAELRALSELQRFFFVGDFANFEQEVHRLAAALARFGYQCPLEKVPRERISPPLAFQSAEQECSIRDGLNRITELDRQVYTAAVQEHAAQIANRRSQIAETSRAILVRERNRETLTDRQDVRYRNGKVAAATSL
jgi:hypothetical protein